jgi:hypothetical protein
MACQLSLQAVAPIRVDADLRVGGLSAQITLATSAPSSKEIEVSGGGQLSRVIDVPCAAH